MIASPGITEIHHACEMNCRPSEMSNPHVGVVGFTPKPRNDRPASARIANGIISVAWTISGATALGSISLNMIRTSLIPTARAATTYSSSRIDNTSPRMIRAKSSMNAIPMAKTTFTTPSPPITAMIPTPRMISGNAHWKSTYRMITLSTHPP
jgi:hypothetical protein